MSKKHFIAFDFDRTLADTFTPHKAGIGVELATSFAIGRLFGERGLRVYNSQGGLRNREPSELISHLLADGASSLDVSITNVRDATKYFVEAKLSYLLPCISAEWPALFPGVKELLKAIYYDLIPAEVAVISSGHDAFIRKTFEVNGLPLPHILITSDTIAEREYPKRPRYKPYPYQLAFAHKEWLVNDKLVHSEVGNFSGRNQEKGKMLYIGDDPIKDAELAHRARIPFGFVPFAHHSDFKPDSARGQFFIPDFYHLKELLEEATPRLDKGASFAEVIFGRSDAEVFPPYHENGIFYKKFLERNGYMIPSKERL